MNLTITPRLLAGAITPPPSKSQTHRLLIAAALSGGTSRVDNVAMSQDIAATLSCLKALGAQVTEGEGWVKVEGLKPARRAELPHLDCGESGSTLRFLIPIALAVAGGGVFTGRGRLMERPQGPYQELFREKGIFWEQKGDVLTVRGRLEAGEYALPGNVSSQFFTGLLYALPLAEGISHLRATTPLESWDYIAMTMDALAVAGVVVTEDGAGDSFHITGPMVYAPGDWAVEADWSQAAFWYAANFAGCSIDIQGLNACSVQGDMRIVPYFAKLQEAGSVDLDVSQCPDLVPPLAAMAALRDGTTRLINAARLRMKESDRLASVSQTLNALGASVLEGPDSLTIQGKCSLVGGVAVDSHNDHRIAMMAAVAAARCEGPVTITGAECVAKSYPNFWEDYEKLGGEIARPGARECIAGKEATQ